MAPQKTSGRRLRYGALATNSIKREHSACQQCIALVCVGAIALIAASAGIISLFLHGAEGLAPLFAGVYLGHRLMPSNREQSILTPRRNHDPAVLRGQLVQFFDESFSSDELRAFLAGLPHGARMIAALPGGCATDDQVKRAAADVLVRHHALDDEFFVALEQERPRRAARIAEMRAAL